MRRASALLLLLAGCSSRNFEGPSLAPSAVRTTEIARGEGDPWRWFLDSARVEGSLDGTGAALPAGLRVDVVPAASLPSRADAHVLSEGVPTPVPAGGGVWPRGGYRSPFAIDAGWEGAKVAVEWTVCAKRRGACAVDVDVVPRLLNCDGRIAVLSELAIHRTLSLDDTIVIAVDPKSPAAETGRLLVGAAGKTGKLMLKVRG